MRDLLPRRRASRIAFALLMVVLVAVLRWLLAPVLGYHSGLILFVPAVMAATWYGGLGPGLVAMVLGALVGESSVAHPLAILSRQNHEAVRAALFVLVGVQIAWGTEVLHRRTREAHAASRAKDDFITVLSHELRTPLTPALLAAEELQDDPKLPDAVRQQAGLIRRNIALEVRLVDDLLDASRIRRGKLQLKRQVVALDQVVQDALGTCQQAMAQKHLQVRLHAPDGPHYVNADPVRLQQVFWNLLRNAVKFTPAFGTIRINIAADASDAVRIQVSDTGMGIAPAVLPRIFDAFEQGSAAVTREFGGLGLGLAITRALVEQHGGTITAASDGPGRGACFVVTLPLCPSPASATAVGPASQAQPNAAHPLRILYVEDHADTRQVMTRLLERLGHRITAVGSVEAALEVSEHHAFDLIITDMRLPDGDGVGLLQAVGALGTVAPAIALTGLGTDEDRRRSQQAGFQAHLAKPVDIAVLQRTIGALARVTQS